MNKRKNNKPVGRVREQEPVEFNFPGQGLTVRAHSLAEAERKAAEARGRGHK